MEFEWNIFPGLNTLQLTEEVKRFLLRLDETPENFTARIIFYVNVQWHFLWIKRQRKECLANDKLVLLFAKRFGKGQWSFIGPGSEKKWYCISEDSPQGVWDNIAERMWVEFRRKRMSHFSELRLHCPEGKLRSKGTWKNCRYTMQPDLENGWGLFFS